MIVTNRDHIARLCGQSPTRRRKPRQSSHAQNLGCPPGTLGCVPPTNLGVYREVEPVRIGITDTLPEKITDEGVPIVMNGEIMRYNPLLSQITPDLTDWGASIGNKLPLSDIFGVIRRNEKCFFSIIPSKQRMVPYENAPNGCIDLWNYVKARSPLSIKRTLEEYIRERFSIPFEGENDWRLKPIGTERPYPNSPYRPQTPTTPKPGFQRLNPAKPKTKSMAWLWWLLGGTAVAGGAYYLGTRKKAK